MNFHQLETKYDIVLTTIHRFPGTAQKVQRFTLQYNPNTIYLISHSSTVLGRLPGFICLWGNPPPPPSLALACHLRI